MGKFFMKRKKRFKIEDGSDLVDYGDGGVVSFCDGEVVSSDKVDLGSGGVDVGIDGGVDVVSDIDIDVQQLYSNIDSELERLKGSGLCDVNEYAELVLLRNFAVRLSRGIGAKFDRGSLLRYLISQCGYKKDEAVSKVKSCEKFFDLLNGYISYVYPDEKIVSVILRVFTEIRGLTKQIIERNMKTRRFIAHEDFCEFLIGLQKHLEGVFVNVGVGVEKLKDFREWYADYINDFVSKKVKKGM